MDANATTIVQRETKQRHYVAAVETAYERACSLRELHGHWTHPRTGVILLYCHVMEIKEDLDFAMYACNSDQVYYADFVEESRRFPLVTIALISMVGRWNDFLTIRLWTVNRNVGEVCCNIFTNCRERPFLLSILRCYLFAWSYFTYNYYVGAHAVGHYRGFKLDAFASPEDAS
jgi:hypothetical protein